MTSDLNEYGQPVGAPVAGWSGAMPPLPNTMTGHYCCLEPLSAEHHAEALFEALSTDVSGWTYLPYGPFDTANMYRNWLAERGSGGDPLFFAIFEERSDRPVGVAAHMRIDPQAGSIEVGHVHFSSLLQRKPAATEAMYLMMKHAFDAGYRRYEWKCDALNAPSRRAAQRFGFSFEGIFRQALVVKGRNRDTAWFSVIDKDWPALRDAFESWLAPDNFDDEGKQRVSLSSLTAPLLR